MPCNVVILESPTHTPSSSDTEDECLCAECAASDMGCWIECVRRKKKDEWRIVWKKDEVFIGCDDCECSCASDVESDCEVVMERHTRCEWCKLFSCDGCKGPPPPRPITPRPITPRAYRNTSDDLCLAYWRDRTATPALEEWRHATTTAAAAATAAVIAAAYPRPRREWAQPLREVSPRQEAPQTHVHVTNNVPCCERPHGSQRRWDGRGGRGEWMRRRDRERYRYQDEDDGSRQDTPLNKGYGGNQNEKHDADKPGSSASSDTAKNSSSDSAKNSTSGGAKDSSGDTTKNPGHADDENIRIRLQHAVEMMERLLHRRNDMDDTRSYATSSSRSSRSSYSHRPFGSSYRHDESSDHMADTARWERDVLHREQRLSEDLATLERERAEFERERGLYRERERAREMERESEKAQYNGTERRRVRRRMRRVSFGG